MYNDLRGGDEDFILRNAIISIAYGVYNHGSVQVASGPQARLSFNALGQMWIGIIGLVIFSTIYIQDLKDTAGDKSRGRRSSTLVLGDSVARWTLAIPMAFWSFACPCFIGLYPGNLAYLASIALGLNISYRVLLLKGKEEDATSWKMWAAWLIIVYTSPLGIEINRLYGGAFTAAL